MVACATNCDDCCSIAMFAGAAVDQKGQRKDRNNSATMEKSFEQVSQIFFDSQ